MSFMAPIHHTHPYLCNHHRRQVTNITKLSSVRLAHSISKQSKAVIKVNSIIEFTRIVYSILRKRLGLGVSSKRVLAR